MQRGKVLNLSKLRFTTFLVENKILIIALFSLLVGIIFGTVMFDRYEKLNSFTADYLENFIILRTDGTFIKIFLNSFFNSAVVLLIIMIFGTSMFGVVTVPLTTAVLGIFYGSVTAYLYSQFALKGIAFNAVIFLPSSIIFIIILMFACRESVKFSFKISYLTVSQTVSCNLSLEFKRFLIMFLIFLCGSVLSALTDATVSHAFIKYFEF